MAKLLEELEAAATSAADHVGPATVAIDAASCDHTPAWTFGSIVVSAETYACRHVASARQPTKSVPRPVCPNGTGLPLQDWSVPLGITVNRPLASLCR